MSDITGKTKARWWPFWTLVIFALSLCFFFQMRDCAAGKVADTKATNQTTKHRSATTSQPQQQTVEAFVLESECDTPCGADIPHNFQIHTEGHALCVRSSGESTWACYPAEGNFPLKSPIHPGWAEFRSDDGKEFHVQIYKRITVPQQ